MPRKILPSICGRYVGNQVLTEWQFGGNLRELRGKRIVSIHSRNLRMMGSISLANNAGHGASGFFFSVFSPKATEPSAVIYLAFTGAIVLAAGLVTLGVGLLKKPKPLS